MVLIGNSMLERIFSELNKLLRCGIKEDMSYAQRRKVMIVNLAGLVGGTCSLAFLVSNLMSGYLLLSGLDLLTMVCGFSMPAFQCYGYKRYPPVIAVVLFSVCCGASSYLYHNHTEYFLLLFIGVSFTIWSNRWVVTFIALLNAGLFFCLQLGVHPPVRTEVPLWNKSIVLAMCLVLYIAFLYYFKRMYTSQMLRISLQNQQLQQWNAHNEKIMSVVAHDIRSPIANVGSVLTMLKEGMLSREEFDVLATQLISQVSNLDVSITSLLGWSKNQLNNPVTSKQVFGLSSLLQEVGLFLDYQLRAKQIKLDTAGLNALWLYADKDQVEIILRNMVSNAIKFSYTDSIIFIRSAQVKGMAHIYIEDKGTGIDPEKLTHIFTPGELVSTYGTQNEKGTGLGLKLARDFARLNGGDLKVFSEQFSGTTCQLILPIANDF